VDVAVILPPPLVHVSNLGVLERSSSSATSTFVAKGFRQDHKSFWQRVRATSHHPSNESIDSLCLLALASHRRQTMTTTVRVPGRKSSTPCSSSSNDIDIGSAGPGRVGWEVPVCRFDSGYDPEVPGAYSVLPVNPEWDGRRVRRRSSSAESASASTSAELFYRTLPVAVLIEADEDDCDYDESCSQPSSCCDLEYEWELLRWTGAPGGGRSAPVMLVVVSDAVVVVASASDSSKCCCSCSDDESTWVARSAYYYAPATLRQLVSNHVLRTKQGEIRAGRKVIILFTFPSSAPSAASRPLLRAAAGYAMMRILRTDPTPWDEEKDTECESGPPCRGATSKLPEEITCMSLTNSRYLVLNHAYAFYRDDSSSMLAPSLSLATGAMIGDVPVEAAGAKP
jgi:hypothetical protein